MKLQKAIITVILGLIALVAYFIMSMNHIKWSQYILEASGLLLIIGGILFLYPILFAKEDKEGSVELDPEAAKGEAAKQ